MAERRYEMLMSSLPYHGKLFGARQTPLSRFQLDKRLAWLEPEHAETLSRIESSLQWRRLVLDEKDTDYLARARELVRNLDNPLLIDIVERRLETRTLIAALRMRALGQAAPGIYQVWGYGRWVDHIRRHWSEPDFHLASVYPWVLDAEDKLRKRDALGLERLFMGQLWEQLARFGAGHYFDFEAVAVYVLRWDLVNRWTKYEEEGARERILELAASGLGEFRQLETLH